jgi:hypothetical protein
MIALGELNAGQMLRRSTWPEQPLEGRARRVGQSYLAGF